MALIEHQRNFCCIKSKAMLKSVNVEDDVELLPWFKIPKRIPGDDSFFRSLRTP